MKIRDSVFGSGPEREFYSRLKSSWADKFNLYPSLPFASIIDFRDIDLTEKARSYLLKTSVDFTLCEKKADKPVVSIEFDGLGHGFSHDGKYIGFRQRTDPNRELKLTLKLQVAEKAGYPLIVVSFDETSPFSEDLELTIADGLIGSILARKRYRELLEERKDELAHVGVEGFMNSVETKRWYEAHGQLYTYDDYLHDRISCLEAIADSECNPVSRQAWVLRQELIKLGAYEGEAGRYVEEPPAPVLKDLLDAETLEKRIQALNDPLTKVGVRSCLQGERPTRRGKFKSFHQESWG